MTKDNSYLLIEIDREDEDGYFGVFEKLDGNVPRKQAGEDVFPGEAEDDQRAVAFYGDIEQSACDVVAEHEQILNRNAFLLKALAKKADGGFAICLLLLAELAAAGPGNVNDQNFGAEALGQIGDGLSGPLGGPGTADCNKNSAHERFSSSLMWAPPDNRRAPSLHQPRLPH
jgi:hypothetical protein